MSFVENATMAEIGYRPANFANKLDYRSLSLEHGPSRGGRGGTGPPGAENAIEP
jgi:hypothetical protein